MKKIIYTSLLFIFTFYATTAQKGFNKKNIFNTFSAFDSAILDGDKVVCVGGYADTIWKTLVAVLDTNGNILRKDIYLPIRKGTQRARSTPMKILRTSDSGYVFVSIMFGNAAQDICYKLDKNYNLEHRFEFRYTPQALLSKQFSEQILLIEDGYLIVGSLNFDNDTKDIYSYVIKTDKKGEKIWEKQFGYEGMRTTVDNLYSDKGRIRLKYLSYNTLKNFTFLIDMDKDGSIVNEKVLKKYITIGSFKVLNDGYLYTTWEQEPTLCKICGYNYVVKSDTNFNTIWKKKFGYLGNDLPWDLKETPDGNYIYTSNTWRIENNKPGDPYWGTAFTYKFSPNGDSIWSRLDTMYSRKKAEDLPLSTSGSFYCLVPLSSNNIIAVGYGNNQFTGGSHAWIVKVSKDGCIEEKGCQLTITDEIIEYDKPLVYPNPTSDIIHFDFEKIEKLNLNISLFDNQGKFLFQKEVLDKKIETIDMSQYPNGFYFYQIKTKDYQYVASGKIIIAR